MPAWMPARNGKRIGALRAAGGWDAFNVTEDADLGVRLARLGYATQIISSRTWEEAPASLKVWRRQRARWLKGWLQTALVHCNRPLRLLLELGLPLTKKALSATSEETARNTRARSAHLRCWRRAE